MPTATKNEPELLAGADVEKDCSRPDGAGGSVETLPIGIVEPTLPHEDDEDEDHHQVSWRSLSEAVPPPVDGLASWRPQRGRWSVVLERLALAIERPINRLTTVQLNPLYHTGTIAFFLLLLVGGTGLYLFFFFQYGYDASYQAVARMESQFIARLIRAMHRYASGALVITTLLHAYRTLFLEKFRGPRWLAWLTGVVMTALLWVAGVTGYALIWDVRAQALTDLVRPLLSPVSAWSERYTAWLATAGQRGVSWALFLAVLVVHVALFLIVVGAFILHIRRLSRPRWFPPIQWVAGLAVILLVIAAIFPVGMLPQADVGRLPGPFTFDPFFLAFLPFRGAWWFWALSVLLLVIAAVLPWVGRRRTSTAPVPGNGENAALPAVSPDARVRIIKDRCTGCTKCALDCPYGAITMVERHDGRPHKYIAIEDVSRCVSCGICVGSCDGVAVTLGATAPESLWGLVAARMAAAPGAVPLDRVAVQPPAGPPAPAMPDVRGRQVVFTCERHALHGARPFLSDAGMDGWTVIPVPCVGTVAPDLLVRTLDAGATAVKVVGCPPDDCANREGNLWTEQRLTRQRVPRLRKPYADAPITADWLPPDAFATALAAPVPVVDGRPDYAGSRRMSRPLGARHFIAAFALLALVLLAQVLLSDLPFTPHPNPPAVARLIIEQPGAPFGNAFPGLLGDRSYEVRLEVDGELVESRVLTDDELMETGAPVLVLEHEMAPGEHRIVLRYVGQDTGANVTLVDATETIERGQILTPAIDTASPEGCSPSPGDDNPCSY